MSTNEPPPPPETPPPGGYGYGAPMPPGPGGPAWNLGDALSYGWKKFQENVGQIIIAAIVLVVAFAIVGAIGFGIQALLTSDAECHVASSGALVCDKGSGFLWRMVVGALVAGLLFVVGQIIGAGIIRGALGITEGRKFETAEIFKTDQIGPVVVASLLVGVLTTIGYALCYLPGIAVAFLTSYTLFFVIDKGLSPVDAIKASFDFTTKNLGNTIVWYIVGGLVALAGIIACFIGLVVTIPMVIIGTAFTYKKLSGQEVAA
ncbi:hypothetical protein [Nocardioides mangrovi]|uniref:Integral membrane protein n=1 Tax=Nocardioides mangrovi TaxID=2874580 RepID=A0ABS7UHI6_9ACTN|nr:hypothetical protein [Nocardioides mangrovi]MBZ5740499.1 hypothetical protein [Nocardioides mangrovi]